MTLALLFILTGALLAAAAIAVAYALASARGDEKAPAQLYVLPADGGEARKLTDLKESVEDYGWSPDSKRLAFTARVRDEAYEEEDEKKRPPRRVTRLFYKLDSVGW